MPSITLVRHGESLGNVARFIQGQTETRLSERGIQQAQLLAKYFSENEYHFDVIFSSPLQRAIDTAAILSSNLNIPITIDPLFMERNFGELEGLTIEEIRERSPKVDFFHLTNPPAPGAENLLDLYDRALNAVKTLTQIPDGNYLLVSHGAFLSMLMYAITGLSPIDNSGKIRFMMENTGYSLCTYDSADSTWRIGYLNRTNHLNGKSTST